MGLWYAYQDVLSYETLTLTSTRHHRYDMMQQASEFGAAFEQSLVTSVDLSSRPFTVTTNTTQIKTHTIIVATGADSKWLGVQGEEDYRGGGVSTCATCDGFLYRDQEVVVIGGGDTAMEDALVRDTCMHARPCLFARVCSCVRVYYKPFIRVEHLFAASLRLPMFTQQPVHPLF